MKFCCKIEWFRILICCYTKTNSAQDQPTPPNHMRVCICVILCSNLPHFPLYLCRSRWFTYNGECVHGARDKGVRNPFFKLWQPSIRFDTRLFQPFRLLTIAKSVSLWKLSIQLCQAAVVCVSADFVVSANTVVLSLPRLRYSPPPSPPLLPPSLSLASSNIHHHRCVSSGYE